MNRLLIIAVVAVTVPALSGCAVGQRREALREMTQFEAVDADGNGVINRAEWDAMRANVGSLKRQ